MHIPPIYARSVSQAQTPMKAAFQRTKCRKPCSMQQNNNDVFMRMAEASLSGTKRGQAIQAELQSMGLI